MDQLQPLELIAGLEKELSLPPGFVADLVKEDDWSFVIKSHALLEASLAHLITSVLAKQELRPIFARLDTSDDRVGKIAFAEALGLLERTDRRFVRSLSELRNLLVHNVSMVAFNLTSYVEAMDSNQFKSFVESYGFALPRESFDIEGHSLDTDKLARLYPRVLIWSGLFTVCGRIILRKTLAAIRESLLLDALIQTVRNSSGA